VRQRSRADHQHALLAQGLQRQAELLMQRGGGTMHDRNLHHRHIGGRIHQTERNPRAMVQAPCRAASDRDTGRVEQPSGAFGSGRRARRRIAHVEQRLREAAKVVDRFWLGGQRDGRATSGFPVRRDDSNRARPWQCLAQALQEAACRAVLQGKHRRAM